MRADPYAAHDPGLTRRFAGLMQLLTAGAVGFLLFLSDSPAQTAATIALACVAATTGAALLRGWAASFGTLLGLTYVNLGGLIVLTVLAGPESDRLEEAYLGVVLSAAALHPPRRVIPLFGLLIAALAVGKADGGGITGVELVDLALHVAIWVFVAAMSSVTVSALRDQRLRAQHDGEAAHREAMSDPLTGLGNRRRLLTDLDAVIADARSVLLVVFDLDGFKAYNDTFGHPAGDALLRRLGERLHDAVAGRGDAYRMGGDEFCVLATVEEDASDVLVADAVTALTEHGDGFTVASSYGAIRLPGEAGTTAEALRLADHRMYARKSTGRTSAARQSTDVLLRVLAERQPALGEHLDGVAALCERVAARAGLPADEIPALVQAARLHDVGKAAIPDEILNKPGPLDDDEWAFMRRHTVIGERILAVAPSLTRAAAIVRSSHERFDGRGYPDGLAGDAIPLGARIVFVCDAYDAMLSDRPYRSALSSAAALAELRSCAGTQFDPQVVEALCAVVEQETALASIA